VNNLLTDQTSINRQQYPIEEQKSASVTRSCMLNIDSRISAQIVWLLNDTTVIVSDSNRRLEDNNQTLRFVALRSYFDQGTFTCKVYSEGGNDTQSFSITVVEVPYRVSPLAELSTVRRTISISWQPPFNGNREITEYIIRSKEISSCKLI